MKDFIISLDIPAGSHEYRWRLGKEFFDGFGNAEILGADISVVATAEKSAGSIMVDCNIAGSLVVACDRCLADLACPVDTTARLCLKYSAGEDEAETDQDGREIILISHDDTDFDLTQIIYDYACLALPIQRTHPDGECDESVVSRMVDNSRPQEAEANPFSALKDLFKN